MKQLKLKIMMSCAGILLGIILLASASYAWMTVSVTPELKRLTISVTPSGKEIPFELSIDYGETLDPDKATWTVELHLDQLVENFSLQPISTVDGVHWYLPKYSANGNVKGFWEADLEDCANKADAKDNYLVYVDVWVRTRNQDTPQEMLLSNPLSTSAGEQYYANYALWDPAWDEQGNLIQNDAMASLRIGFLYTPLDADGKASGASSFYIYEPNGDMRSTQFLSYIEALKSDTSIDSEEYAQLIDRIYALDENGESNKVNQYESLTDRKYYSTVAPQYISEGEYRLVDVTKTLGQNLIVQKTSSWNESKLTPGGLLNSKAIGTIGDFCKVDTDKNTGAATGSLTEVVTTAREEMTTVTYGTIQKMRIFIWLEGQDIDCWNQTAGGSIYANLEFLGRNAE